LRKGNSVVNKIKQNGVKYTIHTSRLPTLNNSILIILLFRNWTYHRIIFTCPIGQVGCRFHLPQAIGQPLMSNPGHTFKTSKNGDIQWIWNGVWGWWAVSGVIGRWSWFYLHIYAAKYVYFWILQRWLARHWGAGVIHAGSRRGYLKERSRIELFMFDKGFGGRQYQKSTLASNTKRD
jgi:hypothetical protein